MIDRDSEKVKTLKQVIEDQKFVIDTLKEAYDEKKNTIHINTEPSALSTEFWEQRGKEAAERINAKNEIINLKQSAESSARYVETQRLQLMASNVLKKQLQLENKTLRKKARQILDKIGLYKTCLSAKDNLIEAQAEVIKNWEAK